MIAPRQLTLEQWLPVLPVAEPGRQVIGCTGHLLLDRQERQNLEQHLQRTVYPALLRGCASVDLVCGMAPGADLLFLRSAERWLEHTSTRVRRIALLPLPLEELLDDWATKVTREDSQPAFATQERMRGELQALYDSADVQVLLDGAPAIDEAGRQQRYRRLAAVLAEQSDVLVALLRDQHLQRPGGTAEVVEWRRHPARIPAELSTRHLRRPQLTHRLWVIDPTRPTAGVQDPGPPPEQGGGVDRRAIDDQAQADRKATVAMARAALRAGNYFRCYDLIRQAQERQIRARELDHLSLLALANAGSTALALERYRALGLDAQEINEDWLALEGRLLKDRAAASSGTARIATYWAAAQAYLSAYQLTGGSYSGINAATQFLLAEQPERARGLAAEVLAGLPEAGEEDDARRYHRHTTRAEAALLLGDVEHCRAALSAASECLRGDLNVRSRSLAQLRLICAKCGCDPAVLDVLTLPPVLFVDATPACGMETPAAISMAFAGLWHPDQLASLQALLTRETPLHLVITAPPAKLAERWRRHHGEAAAAGLADCVAAAQEISIARGFIDSEDDWSARYVAAMARGLSRLTARRLGSAWLSQGADADGYEGAAATPAESGYARQQVGTLFADFVGFTRLDDADLPAFWRYFTQAIEVVRRRHGSRILYHRTWGDALHVVAMDAAATADIATDLRESLDSLRELLPATLSQLEWRLSAHYAPVFRDDTSGADTSFFGSQLSFAARVEPITPPGMIFVTEAFAARLELEAPERYVTEYVGEVDLPKQFGKYRLFNLRSVR